MARRTGLRRTNRKNLRKSMRKGMKRRKNTMRRRNTNRKVRRNTRRKVRRNTKRKVRRNTMKRRNNRRMVGGMVAGGWDDVWQTSWLPAVRNSGVSKYGWVPCDVDGALNHMFKWGGVDSNRYRDGAFIIIDGGKDVWVSTLEGSDEQSMHLFAASQGSWVEQDASIVNGERNLRHVAIGMVTQSHATIDLIHDQSDGSSLNVAIPTHTAYAYASPGDGGTQRQFIFLTGHKGSDGNSCDYTFEPHPYQYRTPENIGTIYDVLDFLNRVDVPPNCIQMKVQLKTWMKEGGAAVSRSIEAARGYPAAPRRARRARRSRPADRSAPPPNRHGRHDALPSLQPTGASSTRRLAVAEHFPATGAPPFGISLAETGAAAVEAPAIGSIAETPAIGSIAETLAVAREEVDDLQGEINELGRTTAYARRLMEEASQLQRRPDTRAPLPPIPSLPPPIA